jgi:hypothetical protein
MSAEGYQKQVKEMYENCLENAKAINGRLGYGYNADTYAKAAAKSLPDVEACSNSHTTPKFHSHSS